MSEGWWMLNDLPIIVTIFTAALIPTVILARMLSGIHNQMNSRMDELLEVTGKAAHAAGVEEERNRPHEPEWKDG